MKEFNNLLRNFIKFLLSLGGVAIAMAVSLVMMVANYLACGFSFYLLGYDAQPLDKDPLIGWLFSSFLPKANLTNLFALGVSLVSFIGIFILFHLIIQIFRLIKDRQQYLDQGDQESARIITQMMFSEAVEFLLFAIPIGFTLYWDVELFRYRSIAGAVGIDDPRTASELVNWGEQIKENGLSWAWDLTRIGAGGYLSITALSCLATEYAMLKTSDNWAKFASAIEDIFQPSASDEEPYAPGYEQDDDTYEHQDLGKGIATQVIANDEHGGTNNENSGWHTEQTGQIFNQEPLLSASPEDGGWQGVAVAEGNNQQVNGDAWDNNQKDGCTSDAFGAPTQGANLHEVIGPSSEKVSMADALAHPERYWVDPDTLQIWDKLYRDAIFGETMRDAA